jgi:adenylate cyclase
MTRGLWQRRTVPLIAVALLAAGVGSLAYATHLLRPTEEQAIDARFSIRGKQAAPANVVLAPIDVATLQEFREQKIAASYPFPRRFDAAVIDRLRRAGAKVVALDIEFSHETDPADDNSLIEAIGRAHGKAVLATTEVGIHGETPVLGGAGLPEKLGARVAEVRFPLDSDGIERRLPYSYNGLRSFPVATAEIATGHRIAASRFEGGTLPIDFLGPPETFRTVSFSKVFKGQFDPDAFRGKVVIVGASAPILQDVHRTATSGSEVMSGPEVWANAVTTLLRGVPLRDTPVWVDVLLIVLMGAAVPLGSLRVARWRSLLDALALAVLFTVGVQLAFDHGWIVSYVYPLLALAVGTLATLAVLYVGEAIERERVRAVFSRFVPAEVVDQVLARTDDNLRLGGVECDCTVLFSDLRGFTSFSETQSAARVIEVVNCYLNEMTEAILEQGGTLITYMGDGIMALFGAPLEQQDHADRAVAAAREMIGPRLERFKAWLAREGFERSFEMGVGLNSGPVMVGNVGSEQRVEYTAIGDTTNTASRLEGMTKDSPAMLFIADSTRERMHRALEELSPVGEMPVRGRAAKLAVWTIWPAGSAAAPFAGGVAEPVGERG